MPIAAAEIELIAIKQSHGELLVRDALEALPPSEARAVDMRLQGYSIAEIAVRLGRSKRSVERVLQKARAKLICLLDVGHSRDGNTRPQATPPPSRRETIRGRAIRTARMIAPAG